MGTADPLYSHIDALVHRILDGFTNELGIFDEAREKLEQFLAEEEKTAEANIQSSAEVPTVPDVARSSVLRSSIMRSSSAKRVKSMAGSLRTRRGASGTRGAPGLCRVCR